MADRVWDITVTATYTGSVEIVADGALISDQLTAGREALRLIREGRLHVDLNFSEYRDVDMEEMDLQSVDYVNDLQRITAEMLEPFDKVQAMEALLASQVNGEPDAGTQLMISGPDGSSPQPLLDYVKSLPASVSGVVVGAPGDSHDNPLFLYRDGSDWCCTDKRFENLQESKAAFGPTPEQAIEAYDDELLKGIRHIERVLTLSTAHWPHTNPDYGDIRWRSHEYGCILFVNLDADAYADKQIPEWLRPILKMAQRYECSLINFDRDVEPIDSLKTYDW